MYSCTGFPIYDHFKLYFELVTPTAEAKVDVYASGIRTNRPGVHKMQLIDELFFFSSPGCFASTQTLRFCNDLSSRLKVRRFNKQYELTFEMPQVLML